MYNSINSKMSNVQNNVHVLKVHKTLDFYNKLLDITTFNKYIYIYI